MIAYPNLTRDALEAFERRVFREDRPTPDVVRAGCLGILNMALATNAWLNNWTPLQNAAGALLERWSPLLTTTDRWLLKLVIAITRRHQGDDVAVALLGHEGMEELPDDVKRRVAAQLIQQSHDSDKMEDVSVRNLANQYLHSVPASARTLAHQHLRGALARLRRLRASSGIDQPTQEHEFDACVQEQIAIASALRQLDLQGVPCLGELSFQISELFLLASMSASKAHFAQAERLHDEYREALNEDGGKFVDLARARACVRIGTDVEWANDRLRALSFDPASPAAHLQRSAHRLLAWLLRTQGDQAEADVVVDRLLTLPLTPGDDGAVFRLLADVDRWTASGATPAEESALIDRMQALCTSHEMMGFGRCVASGTARERLMRFQRYFPY
ncbi:MAG: hypothetical protein IPF98_22550 [Gemmatimonadetes bacterium]|nr:hypothetical protein [Gemmatimonadota bacterium]